MKKLSKILQWTFAVCVLLFVFTYKFELCSVFFILSSFLLMPITPVRKFLKERVRVKSFVLIIISLVFFIMGVLYSPTAKDVYNNQAQKDIEKLDGIIDNNNVIQEFGDEDFEDAVKDASETSAAENKESNSPKDNTTLPSTKSYNEKTSNSNKTGSGNKSFKISDVKTYSGTPYAAVNGNSPYFTNAEITSKAYENYSSLDSLGRCGIATACLGKETMPDANETRGSISNIKPSGWKQAKYDCISGKYLYNRSHLIGWQLSAENANVRNLITGTKYFNVNGMLPFENMVADYIKETNNHVMYRVTPVYKGNNLVCNGVLIEAYSVEDEGDGISFCVFCYNVQPGVEINYADGSSKLSGSEATTKKSTADTTKKATTATTKKATTTTTKKPTTTKASTQNSSKCDYILNTNTGKFHKPECSSVKKMKESNKSERSCTRDELISEGYSPCGICKP